jgi:hypothetical protein
MIGIIYLLREGIMPVDPPLPAIRCPHCGQEIQLDETIADQLTAPTRILWDEELHRVEEQYETKIAKLETQLGRVSKDLVKTQRRTRTGSPTEEGYARQDPFADQLGLPRGPDHSCSSGPSRCRCHSGRSAWPGQLRSDPVGGEAGSELDTRLAREARR